MFKLQDNVPEIYVQESRDFQILCRLYDAIQNSTKYNIDSLRHTCNTKEINNRLLELLKTKLGFFTKNNYSDSELRYILTAFPYIIRYKGSAIGIKYLLNTWFRINSTNARLRYLAVDSENSKIEISVTTIPTDLTLLKDVLHYIIPTGFDIEFIFAEEQTADTSFAISNTYSYIITNNADNSKLRNEELSGIEQRQYNAIGATYLAQESDLKETANNA